MKIKEVFKFLFFIGLGVFFIWWFIDKLQPTEIAALKTAIQNANYQWLWLAIGANILSHYLRALRWRQLMQSLHYNPAIWRSFLSIMLGYLVNLATPRLGEILRCSYIRSTENIPFEKTLGTVITERIIDLILFAMILIVAMVLQFHLFYEYIGQQISAEKAFILGITFLVALLILILFFVLTVRWLKRGKASKRKEKIRTVINGFVDGLRSVIVLKQKWLFATYSVAIWLLWIFGAYLTFRCIDSMSILPFQTAIVLTAFGSVASMITPGGIGLYPAIIAETLLVYGIAKPIGYAYGWLLWGVSQIGFFIFGFFGFIQWSLHKNNDKRRNNTRQMPDSK